MPTKIVTKDILLGCGWEEAILKSERKSCSSYSDELSKLAKVEGIDEDNAAALKLLCALCAMYITHGDRVTLGPWYTTGNGGRTFLPQDLSPEQVIELSQFIEHVTDQELLARIADTIWLSKHHENSHGYAIIAVKAYANSGHTLALEHHIGCAERFSRALSIARELGKAGLELIPGVYEKLKETILSFKEARQDALVLVLLRLMDKSEKLAAKEFAHITEQWSSVCVDGGAYFLARDYLEMAAKWHKTSGDIDKEKRCLLQRLDLFVKEADVSSSKMVESVALQQAIETARRLRVGKKRIEKLHQRLLAAQEEIVHELKLIQTDSFDPTEIIANARRHVSGRTFMEALFRLSFVSAIHEYSSLEEEVHRQAEEFPLSHIMPLTHVNHKGRVIARTPALQLGRGESPEDAVRAHIHKHLLLKLSFEAQLGIEPARMQVLNEHVVSNEEMLRLVNAHPFVPQGRETIWARGLLAGFEGDFLVATHLLVPQLENSLRHVLEVQGGISSKLSSTGVQEEKGLELLLKEEILEKAFGKDLLFTLQALLVEKTGSNLRNEFAHGLMDQDEYYAASAIYFWWLALRLICIPLYNAVRHAAQQTKDKEATS